MPSRGSRVAVVVASFVAVVLLVVGSLVWTGLQPGLTPVPVDTVEPGAVPDELLPYYEQTLAWAPCDETFECASLEVPMDYAEPSGERIAIAVKRLLARDAGDRLGSLVVNPGGPGLPGTAMVDSASEVFGGPVLNAYDIVGFDPRGVGDSTAVECVKPEELDELRAKVYAADDPAGLQEFRDDTRALGEACQANTGRLLAFVDTVSAARDIDVLRAALGDARLTFLGFSYGTLLGATYADLFPGRVGRMVLDGGIDPTLDRSEQRYGQAAGFEAALRAYVEDCLAGDGCPLRGTVDEGVGQVKRFLDLLEGSPLPTGTERELTQALAVSGILASLYDDRFWPILNQALSDAIGNDDGAMLLLLADSLANREPDGDYASNTTVAIRAISCLDEPTDADPDAMAAEATRLSELSPTFGEFFAYGDIVCDEWPVVAAVPNGMPDASGAAPILVVGTTRDPATPYAWSEGLADQLESGHHLTYDGQGHTAYGRANDCLENAVDRYLVRGELPADRLVC